MVYYPVQTLTVGTAGLLTSVELDVQRLSGMGTLTVSLFPVVQEYNPPVFGSLLAAIVVAGEAVSTSMSTIALDFSTYGLVFAPGDRLAIALQAGAATLFNWAANYPNSYNGGISYSFIGGLDGPLIYNANFDVAFRTLVDPTGLVTVPEPASLALFGAGLLGLAAVMRRRVV
ncbi:PEP-CTERM sorting domain-containing protein [Roseomonas nepalensis]|uniref:PEP-CTERM sorting domain-containing protein n=2 Tax=Muricoccus nepalensis TaxID=1854500 RepID=A0A502F8N0_9PROT|nr:PEP-CTERM sorting domain-containing protein [Roseomonas nepalensis]